MKPLQIRELSEEELKQKEEELTEQIFKLRFQVAIGQIDNPQKLKQVRRDIARIKTIKREKTLKGETEESKPREEKEKKIKEKKVKNK